MSETKPWTREEIKLLVDQVPKPINAKRYPPNPNVVADLAVVRAAKDDGRHLELNETQRRIIDARLSENGVFVTFYDLGQELGMSRSSVRNSYERIIRNLKNKK